MSAYVNDVSTRVLLSLRTSSTGYLFFTQKRSQSRKKPIKTWHKIVPFTNKKYCRKNIFEQKILTTSRFLTKKNEA